MKIILLNVDDNDDCKCGCNDDGDDNNGLVQFHILVSSKLSIVSLKVFTVPNSVGKLKDYCYCYSKGLSISVALALFPVQVFCHTLLHFVVLRTLVLTLIYGFELSRLHNNEHL